MDDKKNRLAQIRQAEADERVKAENELRPSADHNSKRGRPKESASKRTVAEVTGISRQSRDRIETHVTLAEQYPVMQRAFQGDQASRIVPGKKKIDSMTL
jgi:hypothetical protein